MVKTESNFKIKAEPMETAETGDFDIRDIVKKDVPLSDTNAEENSEIKIKSEIADNNELSTLKIENLEIPFIKVEKADMEDC